ncbi:N-acetylmuramidase family protein [Faucicola atlantae]|uniref:N-acetylmuramidase domain-containing protein n=1 Tax=Faucicola atlantae TaxID=34059 RepID=A0A1B8QCX3_9GAMM|nr:N-acetylmuramidase family protein [Moraxella atlantae]OBX79129.1 hypothetical protein A9306_08945 [Moraxella atlantae]
MTPPKPKTLTEQDFIQAAKRLRCDVSAIRAVAEVESRSGGFLFDECAGEWRPKVLYERHVFYRRYKDRYGTDKALNLVSRYSDIVCNIAGGYIGGAAEHRRIEKARKLDKNIGLESASWGMFQLMGYHWQSLGYASVVDFVLAMSKDEANQLEAFVRFIEANKTLLNAIRAKDWSLFALTYNGKAYRQNQYDAKMARANSKYAYLNKALDT